MKMRTYEVWAVEVLGPGDEWSLVQVTNFEVNGRKMIERKHHKEVGNGKGKGTWTEVPPAMVFGSGVPSLNKKYRKGFPVYRYRRVTVS